MTESSTYITVDKKGRATLPEEVREDLGISEGDIVILEKTERGTYELVPASLVPRDQLWFYHPEMQARIAEGEQNFRDGRYTSTKTPEEARAFLDSLKKKSPRKRSR
jgi:AbrB family looped-hinge helix DNA binding protein